MPKLTKFPHPSRLARIRPNAAHTYVGDKSQKPAPQDRDCGLTWDESWERIWILDVEVEWDAGMADEHLYPSFYLRIESQPDISTVLAWAQRCSLELCTERMCVVGTRRWQVSNDVKESDGWDAMRWWYSAQNSEGIYTDAEVEGWHLGTFKAI